MSASYDLTIKWGKETVEFKYDPATGVKGLQSELQERTQVPADRMKIMSKSKGLWKGVLRNDEDLSKLDWKTAAAKGGVQMLLMGSAAQLDGPKKPVVFLEDLPPEEIAKVQEPAGLINLGVSSHGSNRSSRWREGRDCEYRGRGRMEHAILDPHLTDSHPSIPLLL